jgi:signal transduction histidine kinase
VTASRLSSVALGALGVLLALWAAFAPYLLSTDLHWSVTPVNQAVHFVGGLLWVPVLLITYRREPSGSMWKLVLLYLAATGTWVLGYLPNDWTWTAANALAPLADVVFVHLVLVFPDGRLRHRFDRWFVVVLYLTVVTSFLSQLFWEPPFLTSADCLAPGACLHNALLVWPNETISLAFRAANLLAPVYAVLTLVELRRHWREAGPTMRRTLAPVMVGVPIVFAILVPWYVAQAIDRDEIRRFLLSPLFSLPAMIIPAGFLIGLLRTRLARGSVADLALELGRGVPVGGLQAMLARALRDPTLQLFFPAPGGGGWVDPEGRPVDLPVPVRDRRAITRLEGSGEVLAVLAHDPLLDVEDPGLVAAVGSVARLALENERLSAQIRAQLEEVHASRARIVEAADAERRRVERDLHDGAQQRLVALAMRLELARERPDVAEGIIEQASSELRTAIAEVRDLARGLHPPILAEAGLAAAIDSLAERTPVAVSVEAPPIRFAAPVETTAYYVVAEALTNVARYAGATEARVRLAVAESTLRVEVADDGRGGADPALGSGLRGLADRVAAAGGRFVVISPPEGGTRLLAELPLT